MSLLYNLLLHHEQRRPWWSKMEPRLILGALPLREKNHLTQVRGHWCNRWIDLAPGADFNVDDAFTATAQLVDREGVQAIVTMNQPHELLPNLLGTPVSPCKCCHQIDYRTSVSLRSLCVAFSCSCVDESSCMATSRLGKRRCEAMHRVNR